MMWSTQRSFKQVREVRSTLHRLLLVLAIFALIASSSSPTTFSQSTTGSIQGLVTDRTGAVLPGTRVQVTNIQTGVTQVTRTNDRGAYLFASLPPGEYTLQVQKEGFANATASGIILQIDQKIALDVPLDVGAAAVSVRVDASNEMLETQAASVGEVIQQQLVQSLPTLGREFLSLSLRFHQALSRAPPIQMTQPRITPSTEAANTATPSLSMASSRMQTVSKPSIFFPA